MLSSMNLDNIKSNILLTGAGFTHNFGGFLGNEMWAKIFNNPDIQKQARLRNLLLYDKKYGLSGNNKNFDFESVYSKVINSGDYSSDEVICIQQAVEQAYHSLNAVLVNKQMVDFYPIRKLFDFFKGDGNKTGLCFTLNQDQLLERYFDSVVRRPGITSQRDLDPNEHGIILPKQEELNNHDNLFDASRLSYIKLHGSYRWYSSDGKNGAMVLGKNKKQDLEKEPILKLYYYDIFKKIITTRHNKLLVIGYGFRDEHINDVLAQASQKRNLKLYIIHPKDPKDFKVYLHRHSPELEYQKAQLIWEAVCGYFPYKIMDIFPKMYDIYNDRDSPLWAEIKLALNS